MSKRNRKQRSLDALTNGIHQESETERSACSLDVKTVRRRKESRGFGIVLHSLPVDSIPTSARRKQSVSFSWLVHLDLACLPKAKDHSLAVVKILRIVDVHLETERRPSNVGLASDRMCTLSSNVELFLRDHPSRRTACDAEDCPTCDVEKEDRKLGLPCSHRDVHAFDASMEFHRVRSTSSENHVVRHARDRSNRPLIVGSFPFRRSVCRSIPPSSPLRFRAIL